MAKVRKPCCSSEQGPEAIQMMQKEAEGRPGGGSLSDCSSPVVQIRPEPWPQSKRRQSSFGVLCACSDFERRPTSSTAGCQCAVPKNRKDTFLAPPICVVPISHQGHWRISATVMNETTNLEPRRIATYWAANSGCHLKMKLATSVSTTSLAVAVGGEVAMALLIDAAYELFGFLLRSRIDVAQ